MRRGLILVGFARKLSLHKDLELSENLQIRPVQVKAMRNEMAAE